MQDNVVQAPGRWGSNLRAAKTPLGPYPPAPGLGFFLSAWSSGPWAHGPPPSLSYS